MAISITITTIASQAPFNGSLDRARPAHTFGNGAIQLRDRATASLAPEPPRSLGTILERADSADWRLEVLDAWHHQDGAELVAHPNTKRLSGTVRWRLLCACAARPFDASVTNNTAAGLIRSIGGLRDGRIPAALRAAKIDEFLDA